MQPGQYPYGQPHPAGSYPPGYPGAPYVVPAAPMYPPTAAMYGQYPPSSQSYYTPVPVMPAVAVGSTIVKAPSIVPPPGWKPSITSAENSLLRQPIQLYIGKIPPELSDVAMQKILECCGRVQKWNRSVDAATQIPKAFGLVTFEYGINALRCMNVLPHVEIYGQKVLVKAGTKEQALLDEMAKDEEVVNDGGKDATIEQIRQNIEALLSSQQPSIDQMTDRIIASSGLSTSLADGKEVIDSGALSEIEKFRSRQAMRDKELELKRQEKIKEKLIHYEQQSKQKEELKTDKSKSKSKDSIAPDAAANLSTRSNVREREDVIDEEELEAKRQRKQQVLEMLAGGNTNDMQTKTSSSMEKYQEMAMPSIKVKLGTGSLNAASTKKFAALSNQENDDKPRAMIPLDFTEDELRTQSHEAHNFDNIKHSLSYLDDTENLHEKKQSEKNNKDKGKDDFTSSGHDLLSSVTVPNDPLMKQAHMLAVAQLRAKEIAARISSNISTTTNTNAMSKEDAEKLRQKQIVDKIPIDKADLFAFQFDWKIVDEKDIINTEMKPWIRKKVVEYLGDEENTFISFIISQLTKHCTPKELLEELNPVLDEDTETFVVKLWRMLVFCALKNSP